MEPCYPHVTRVEESGELSQQLIHFISTATEEEKERRNEPVVTRVVTRQGFWIEREGGRERIRTAITHILHYR